MLALRGGLSVDALGLGGAAELRAMLPLLGVQLGVQLIAVSGACVPAEAPPAATPSVAQRSRRRLPGWVAPRAWRAAGGAFW